MTFNVLAALAAIAGIVIALLVYGIAHEARHAQELDDQGWTADWSMLGLGGTPSGDIP